MTKAGRTSVLPDLFDATSETTDDPGYVAARDHITKEETRAKLENAWRTVMRSARKSCRVDVNLCAFTLPRIR
jgi:hypothetical protein